MYTALVSQAVIGICFRLTRKTPYLFLAQAPPEDTFMLRVCSGLYWPHRDHCKTPLRRIT
ncbi:hypothetical protein Misp06_02192 [Microbulbifer sp. NBRC 101763]